MTAGFIEVAELGGIVAGLVVCKTDRRAPRCEADEDAANSRDEGPAGGRQAKESPSSRASMRMRKPVRPIEMWSGG